MARIKVVAIKHFVGCTTFEEVKIRYKKLAMQFHPDRPTGSHASFVELQAELDYIKEYSPSYPLGSPRNPIEDIINGMYGGVDAFAEAARKARQAQEQQRKAAEDLARRQRAARQAANPWGPSSDRADDPFWGFSNSEPRKTRRKSEAQLEDEKWERMLKDRHPIADVYRVIKGVADEAFHRTKTGNWMLMEVYKLDDLEMDHFKFLKWYLKKVSTINANLNDGWVGQTYRNYVAVKNINWEVE